MYIRCTLTESIILTWVLGEFFHVKELQLFPPSSLTLGSNCARRRERLSS
jgi:hypothetical protein